MKYREFRIQNYKAIDDVNVDLSRNVIPLIGINESGKTSILQAILAFDNSKDNVLNGTHIDPKNKYKTIQSRCKITAKVEVTDEEFRTIGESAKLNMDSEIYHFFSDKIAQGQCFELCREHNGNEFEPEYKLAGTEAFSDQRAISKVVKALIKMLPNILYFDDFSDRVPEEVAFPKDFSESGKFGRGKIREWQEIINEIFARALDEDFSLKTFLELEDRDDQENYLNDVNQTLNDVIISEWQELKSVFSSDTDDNLELKLRHTATQEGSKFEFKVMDAEQGGKNRVFNINHRSKGFQWFFNFIMKLKFNPKYKTHPDNAIYLLDEPGSYLHASAQTELLKKLCEMSNYNTIIYCTHSQYLLDPDVINIADIQIVSKDDGRVKIESYGESTINRSAGAFSALNDALQLKFGISGNRFKKVIITEGIVDYYFLNMFTDLDDFTIIPGSGAGNLKDLISIMISCSEQFLVILDNDSAGRKAKSKYQEYFGDAFSENCYQYEGVGDRHNSFAIENLIGENDAVQIKSASGINDLKKAITGLYFMKEKIPEIIDNLETDSKERIGIVKRKILNHFTS